MHPEGSEYRLHGGCGDGFARINGSGVGYGFVFGNGYSCFTGNGEDHGDHYEYGYPYGDGDGGGSLLPVGFVVIGDSFDSIVLNTMEETWG
jgi:hypothetical protein